MGSRGSFVDVDKGDFTFVDGGQTFRKVAMVDDVVVLERISGGAKAPEYSHSADRIYAVIQKKEKKNIETGENETTIDLKHLAFYDKNHNQKVSIDFQHEHNGAKPHVHFNLIHDKNEPGISPTKEQLALANKIIRRLKLNAY